VKEERCPNWHNSLCFSLCLSLLSLNCSRFYCHVNSYLMAC
jgi:hypothetical protein